ncbi:MAG TPA: ABC transporter substrate-binding protein, partial [Smithellaceae bacterium]|nr:ABC transporter substrate-binding protein [Smithellaceae bacterium]
MRKLISVCIAITIVFFLLSCLVCAQTKSIKVGAAINLTGPASTWGQFHEKGQRDYFRYVNEVKGGVFGQKIEMITVDTAYKVPEAVAAVQKFVLQDKV